MQVLEYIEQNYTLFLVAGILILLAFIGYYADKTNFGQGKNKDSDEKNKKDLKHMRLSEVVGKDDSQQPGSQTDEMVNLENKEVNSDIVQKNPVVDFTTAQEKSIENSDNVNSELINPVAAGQIQNSAPSDVTISNTNSVEINANAVETVSVEQVNEAVEDDNSLLNEEVFNKFNEEFNLLMPEKELISTDLLSDIDDLELGKTQKLDLTEIPALGDIELPKIKNLSQEEQDIWKF